ncbi:MAG: hypothetical protein ACTS5I_11295 [Rhodanobacter sp.]
MNAKYWLIGCALGFTGIGCAAATDVRDLLDTSHSRPDSSSRTNAASHGSLSALPASTPVSDTSGSGCNPDLGDDGSSGATSAPAAPQRSHLGWQSLLPGSIQ